MPRLFKENHITVSDNLLNREDMNKCLSKKFGNLSYPSKIAAAESLLNEQIPALPASLYMEFYRNGNRSRYEDLYFRRRNMIMTLLLAEITERKGRFTDKLIDCIWAVCDESTWVIPAHNKISTEGAVNCLPDTFNLNPNDRVRNVDLFSAGTGSLMAWVWYLGEDILDGVNPVIRRRIRMMIENRIFWPFNNIDGQENWWMGVDVSRKLNNWTPWIVSNVLTAFMICGNDTAESERALERSMMFLDNFTAGYADDGGCDEGPSYWGEAGASYFDCLELIGMLTGGRIDLTDNVFVRRMCEYIVDVNLGGNIYANFGDASHLLSQNSRLIARMGRKCGSDKLKAFASSLGRGSDNVGINVAFRGFMNYHETVPEISDTGVQSGSAFYAGIGLGVMKNSDCGFALAIKGGDNNVSHNHNDIGSFMLFCGGRSVFVDPGVEEYTRTTFSDKRYTLWTMQSGYHNVPVLNGVEQKPGSWHADMIEYGDGYAVYDMTNAYPDEAGLKGYRRSASLSVDGLVIRDEISFADDGETVFTLMCVEMPVIGEGTLTFETAGVKAEYDCGLSCEIDDIALEDKLKREWNCDKLIRVRLKSDRFRTGSFELKVRGK